MRIPTIKELMREQASFVKYQYGKLWYQIIYSYLVPTVNEDQPFEEAVFDRQVVAQFDFPVPLDDAGGGEFHATEKAVYLMRWIRKHIEYLKEAVDGAS